MNQNIDKFASHKCNYLRSPEDETRLFRPADKIYSGTTANKNYTLSPTGSKPLILQNCHNSIAY